MCRGALISWALLSLVASHLSSQLLQRDVLVTEDFVQLQLSFPECRIPAFKIIFKWKVFGTFDHSVVTLQFFSVLLFSLFWGGSRDAGIVRQDGAISVLLCNPFLMCSIWLMFWNRTHQWMDVVAELPVVTLISHLWVNRQLQVQHSVYECSRYFPLSPSAELYLPILFPG